MSSTSRTKGQSDVKAEASIALRTVKLQGQGRITLPAEWRQELALSPGDDFTLIKLNGYFLLAPRRLVVPEMADTIARLAAERGVTLSDLLAGLREERALLYEERYANATP